MKRDRVSEATVARLPSYLRVLVDAATDGAATISSEHLAQLSGNQPATVRRDLSSLSITGTRGVGYDVKHLVYEISVVLGVNQEWPVVIVGSGNLGRALANYEALADRGFPVRVLIDIDPALVGQRVAGVVVSPLDQLERLVHEQAITVGVIATPANAAQDVADHLVAAGVTSLLNFTSTPLVVDDDVQVRGVDLATELQILSFYQQRTSSARDGVGVPLATLRALEQEAAG
ncbi:MAG: redox-sensing transcriptional repressor Rex [Acidimicrobiales bacterium]